MKPFVIGALFFGLGSPVASARWQPQSINSVADFRGVSAVSPKVAWVSGTKGTFGRTTDGGKTWTVGTVPDADTLDFRDVEAFGEDTSYLLSAGPGESLIYKTTDDPAAFTIRTTLRRVERIGDMWQVVLGEGIDLAACLERLSNSVK